MRTKTRFASLAGRRGVASAAAAAVIVLAVVEAQNILNSLLYLNSFIAQGSLAQLFTSGLWGIVFLELPFACGVFLCLWLLAPIGAELTIGRVILRSLIAVVAGVVVVFVIDATGGLVGQVSSSDGMVFGWAAAIFGATASSYDYLLSNAVHDALSAAISLFPSTVLAGVVVWAWLQSHPVSGGGEEV